MILKSARMHIAVALLGAGGVLLAAGLAEAGQAPQPARPAQPSAQQAPMTPEAQLSNQLSIDATRVDTMVSKSEDAADTIFANKMPTEAKSLREYDDNTMRNLKMAILRYNLLITAACALDQPNREFCGEPYLPDWLRAPTTTTYNRTQMQTMIREANTRLTPFWNAVCVRGRTAKNDQRFCDLQ